MRISLVPQQTQTMSQKLVMSPRMFQSMEILQLPMQALAERIEQELTENPLLELQESDPSLPEEASERENPDAPTSDEKELVVDEAHNNADDFERLLNLDQDVPDHFDEQPRKSASRMEEEAGRQHDAMANLVERQESLQDYLHHQLGELDIDRPTYLLCERIISSLDPHDGYLKVPLVDLLPADAPPEMLEDAQHALEIVQHLEPAGVAARNLKECLLLQLTPDMDYFDELELFINNHLEDLAENRLPQIEKATGFVIEEIHDIWEQLRLLNPKPGAEFAETIVRAVTPDLFIERESDGKYRVVVEDSRTPRLRISEYYRKRLANGTATPEEKEFIKRKVNAAQWIIEAIEQRRGTLTKVAQAIVDYQTRFLEDGPEFIEPLKMEQIAEKVGVHVTTVSRAVQDKWAQTPRGILPLRKFFVGGTQGTDGEDVAWDKIRIKLQEVVDGEDKQKPYSDDALVKLLKAQGIKVARRTVTKYRQKMGIPNTRQRREWKD